MKTGTYTKTGKSQNGNNSLKGKENLMKSGTYKKQNGKVVEISNNNNKLEDNSPEAVLLSEYQTIFDKITKGSKVVNFIKTSEYKESLIDVLQDIVTSQIESKEYLDYQENIKGLLYQRLSDRTIDQLRKDSTFDIFKNDYSDYVESQDYGITKQYLNEMLIDIKRILTISEYEIFKLYHVKSFSTYQIAEKLDTSQSDISRQVKNISNKILGTDKKQGLCYKTLFDSRYVSYQSQGKKRQHKRKVLTKKEIIELSGKPYKLGLELYESQKPLKPEKIPANKALQYPTKVYFKRHLHDISIISDNEIDKNIEYLSSLVYTKSHLPIEVKGYSAKEYRRKRYIRQYVRSLKIAKKENKPYELFDGYKSYLYSDGIQG